MMGNYHVGKGRVSFKRAGDTEFQDLGTVSGMMPTISIIDDVGCVVPTEGVDIVRSGTMPRDLVLTFDIGQTFGKTRAVDAFVRMLETRCPDMPVLHQKPRRVLDEPARFDPNPRSFRGNPKPRKDRVHRIKGVRP
jgi:hypothetical protein